MATHISIALWDEVGRKPSVLLADLVRHLENAAAVEKPWQWFDDESSNGLSVHRELDSSEVLTFLNECSESARVTVGTSYRVHPDGTKAFAVRAWENPANRSFAGDADLNFRLLRHFANEGSPPSDYVAQNVLDLYELLVRLVDETSIGALRAYHDWKLLWPLNAHFAYFRSPQTIIDDIALIERLWRQGGRYQNVKPLVGDRTELKKHIVSYAQAPRDDVYDQLQDLIPYAGRVNEDIVRAELAQSRFDISQPDGGGWFVMQFPYAFDHYIDGFYFDVLRRAMGE